MSEEDKVAAIPTDKKASATPILIALVAMIALGGGIYVYQHRGNGGQEAASKALSDQGVELSEESFLKEVAAGHEDNVRNFLIIGMNPGAKNAAGLSALNASLASGNDAITNLLLSAVAPAPGGAPIVNDQDVDGKTPLIVAVERNNSAALTQIIAKGADPAIADKAQENALTIAINHKFDTLVPPLLAADKALHQPMATLEAADAHGSTPLILAVREDDAAIVKALLESKASVDTADARGVTPLMVAAESGSDASAAELLAAGAKLDLADHFGNTPLSIALQHNHPAVAKLLLDKGADPDFHKGDTSPLQTAINADPYDGAAALSLLAHSKNNGPLATPLLFSIMDRKDPALAAAALARGFDPHTVNERGETLLFHAIDAGLEDSALLLIDKGADVSRGNASSITPLESAVEHNEPKVVKKLLSMGAPADQKIPGSYTMAEFAVYKGYPETLDALLSGGAPLRMDFALLWSIRDGGGKVVPVLLAHGAKANVMSGDGNTALWLAAAAGQVEATAALAKSKGTLDVPNQAQGIAPLAVAAHNGQLATVKILVDAGANKEVTDNFGMTPLGHAAYMSKPDIVEYLIGKGANAKARDHQNRSIADLASFAAASPDRDKVIMMLQGK